LSRSQRRRLEQQARQKGAVDLKAPELSPDPAKIAIGYAWSEKRGVSGFWHKSVIRTLAAFSGQAQFSEIAVEGGPFLSRHRNRIVKAFLEGDSDYLLMTDTDAVFDPGDVKALLDARKPIAGALAYTAGVGTPPFAAVMLKMDEGDYEVAPEDFFPEVPPPPTPMDRETVEALEELQRQKMLEEFQEKMTAWTIQSELLLAPKEVGAIGCTLTLYRRDVVEAVAAKYEHPFEYVGDVGEDITFCDRAKELGFESWVVPQARIGHVVEVVL
jgi:hypothetical protein